VTTQGVGWASEETSDLVAPPLNLVLYIHFLVGGMKFRSKVYLETNERQEAVVYADVCWSMLTYADTC
jgi:hypothetical protein